MNPRTWQRKHLRLTVRIVQTGPTHFDIPLQDPSRTPISVDGSLKEAQLMADALSGCVSDCRCPTWTAGEDSRHAAPLASVRPINGATMTEEAQCRQRLGTIAALLEEAARLRAEARDERSQGEVTRAIRELDETRRYLSECNIDARPSILAIADVDIEVATYRLKAAQKATGVYTPDGGS